ncbi:hypothetical protein C5N14_13420 [Micromonospora sp. MW-13]|uniref:hypothetical protein n=1 Tax=Micromonospora sp. MW-13 TaxID=2094022 RepID=UPI000E443A42|nr:hypothetical protein [Micromonospora sp. MW-13]RGC68514.1 hypothetical protein C5N14_13420 [Micromonospora sp. MW-13]
MAAPPPAPWLVEDQFLTTTTMLSVGFLPCVMIVIVVPVPATFTEFCGLPADDAGGARPEQCAPDGPRPMS